MASIQSIYSKLGDVMIELEDLITEEWEVRGGQIYSRLMGSLDSVADAHYILRHVIQYLQSKGLEGWYE